MSIPPPPISLAREGKSSVAERAGDSHTAFLNDICPFRYKIFWICDVKAACKLLPLPVIPSILILVVHFHIFVDHEGISVRASLCIAIELVFC
jgi:hypothetical protein